MSDMVDLMDVVNLENLVTCVNLLDMDGSGESGSDRPGQLGESVKLTTSSSYFGESGEFDDLGESGGSCKSGVFG